MSKISRNLSQRLLFGKCGEINNKKIVASASHISCIFNDASFPFLLFFIFYTYMFTKYVVLIEKKIITGIYLIL